MARPRKHPLPSIADLHQLYDYDPQTGEFHHKWRDFGTRCAQWNARFAGEIAGTKMNVGYWFVRAGGQALLAHRVAWAMHYGEWPAQEIDHRDGNKLNNAIDNLRAVSRVENCRNRPGRALSGYKGVIATKGGRYQAYIGSRGTDGGHYLGTYDTAEAAHEAFKAAALERYGDFANFEVFRIGSIAATITFGVAA